MPQNHRTPTEPTPTSLQTALGYVPRRQVTSAGTGVMVDEGSGEVGLTDTGVTAAVYGDATHVAQVEVDAQGRVVDATDVAITFPSTFAFIGLTPTAVASLPTPSTGRLAFVTDATLTAITGLGLTVVGGGGNKVPVYADGTNWIIL